MKFQHHSKAQSELLHQRVMGGDGVGRVDRHEKTYTPECVRTEDEAWERQQNG